MLPLSQPQLLPLSNDPKEVTVSPFIPIDFIEYNPIIKNLQEDDGVNDDGKNDDGNGDNPINREEQIESVGYKLPPRSTRGIPSKRHDLEYEAQRSKYSIDMEDRGTMV